MLEAACVLSAAAERWEEFAVILTMLLINGGVGWWHESRAAAAIGALKKTLSPKARGARRRRSIEARDLAPDDIIVLRRGDVAPADAKLLGDALSIDESALTGKSLPADKQAGDAIYAGTAVKRGEAQALVTGTGRRTRFGRTIELVAGVQERSHFQKAVLHIGYFLMGTTVVLVTATVMEEFARGGNPAGAQMRDSAIVVSPCRGCAQASCRQLCAGQPCFHPVDQSAATYHPNLSRRHEVPHMEAMGLRQVIDRKSGSGCQCMRQIGQAQYIAGLDAIIVGRIGTPAEARRN